MGAWGYEPFESDSDLDWRGDFNDDRGLRKALIKAVKQKEWAAVSRAAIEYAIRMDDAGLMTVYGDNEFIDTMLKRARELEKEFADPSGYEKLPGDSDNDTVRQSIRGHVASVDRQIKYLEGLRSKQAAQPRDVSKKELMDAFERLKKKQSKGKAKSRAKPKARAKTRAKSKAKGPVADRKSRIDFRQELIDAYARLKESES